MTDILGHFAAVLYLQEDEDHSRVLAKDSNNKLVDSEKYIDGDFPEDPIRRLEERNPGYIYDLNF